MEQNDERDGWRLTSDANKSSSVGKLETYFWKLARWWGFLFRMAFIAFIGTVGYFWIGPKEIGDTPFAELTLNDLFENLFFILLVMWCTYWFFSFPDQKDAKSPSDNPYVKWGQFGGWVALVVFAVVNVDW